MLLHLDIDDEEIDNFHKKIACNIKKIRKEKNISQTELALRIGHKSVSMLGKIEAGLENKHYNIEQLYKISKALDVDIKEFF
jgi:transcriptional regulator with XRE-family HTH domain